MLGDVWREIQGSEDWKGLIDPMNPILRAEILRFGDFAQLCYDGISKDRSRTKRLLFQQSENLQDCGYEITEDVHTNIHGALSYLTGQPKSRSCWMGCIAVCTDPNEIRRLGRRDIVVAWGGTTKRREWIQNLKDLSVPHIPTQTNSNHDVRIHKGFGGYYTAKKGNSESDRSAKDIVRQEITRLLNEYKDEILSITFTGHSLGGALATLSAYDIKQMLAGGPSSMVPVTVFAFASPRVGNQDFTLDLDKIGVKVLRLVIEGDLVTHVPGLLVNEHKRTMLAMNFLDNWAYFHVGTEIRLDYDSSPSLRLHKKNPINLHKLNVCLHLIDGFRGSNQPFESSERGRKYISTSI